MAFPGTSAILGAAGASKARWNTWLDDALGEGNDLTQSNVVEDTVERAAQFAHASNIMSATSTVSRTGDFTATAWATRVTDAANRYIMATTTFLDFLLNSRDAKRIGLFWGGTASERESGGSWPGWHLVAFTAEWNAGTSRWDVAVYKDGAVQTSAALDVTAPSTLAMHIGNRSDLARPWEGYIRDVRLYSTALTQAQLQTLESSTDTPAKIEGYTDPNATSLLAWWPLFAHS